VNCKKFDEHILQYLTGNEIDEELSEALKQHYLKCDTCWDKYVQHMKLIDALQDNVVKEAFSSEPEPDRVEELLEYAQTLNEIGNIEEAIKCLEEALKLRPGDQKIKERLLSFVKIAFDDEEQTVSIKDEKISLPLYKLAEIKIDYPGQPELCQYVSTDDIIIFLKAASSLQKDQNNIIYFETEKLLIEIKKGIDKGLLTITIKI